VNDNMTRRLSQVLADLRFPAEKWEIITCAELYGADAGTYRLLWQLPIQQYRDTNDIARTLAARTNGGSPH